MGEAQVESGVSWEGDRSVPVRWCGDLESGSTGSCQKEVVRSVGISGLREMKRCGVQEAVTTHDIEGLHVLGNGVEIPDGDPWMGLQINHHASGRSRNDSHLIVYRGIVYFLRSTGSRKDCQSRLDPT
jgi:hypothetical protein